MPAHPRDWASWRAREPGGVSSRPAAVTDTMTPMSQLARFDALFTEHKRQVLAYAMRRTQTLADAEDVAAETFIIAWRKLGSIPATEPLAWLYAVARRVLANHRRGNGRRERLAALLRVEDVATPLRAGEDLDGPVFAALASLSPADQEILRLIAWEELGNQGIAVVLGITANAVAIRLHRARARFADALARETPDDHLKYPGPTRTSAEVKGTDEPAWKGVAE
jgi:RNA polymerase sigma-70 factor, ECF subfamily